MNLIENSHKIMKTNFSRHLLIHFNVPAKCVLFGIAHTSMLSSSCKCGRKGGRVIADIGKRSVGHIMKVVNVKS